ncbi:glycosyltransferase [Leifsonia flava]|uniref:Glycosyltransferase n=1 Tax=Orlajensenia leifsoniae TaxID=2561933 RepID=A0A4Y9R8Y9_9MICO|nr:glycosyltransferase [Leifsonia flava]
MGWGSLSFRHAFSRLEGRQTIASPSRPPHPPLRILQSFGEPGPTTNPYLTQVLRRVPGVAQRAFTWRTALFGRYDVFHLHLPDVLFLRRSRVRSAGGALLFLALLLRLRLTGTALVRTAHNLAPHERRGVVANTLDRLSARGTALWIRLNDRTTVPDGAAVATILHGDYIEWFSGRPHPPRQRGRLLFFGLIRPYKGVDDLVTAFQGLDDPDTALRIVGRATPELQAEIEAAAVGDRRIDAAFEYVDDERLAEEVGEAELVVLPYREMHNSGVAILALSLGRPILVPENETNADLATEVGETWVQRFSGTVDAADLARALAAVRDLGTERPDLSRRSWSTVGSQHAQAYERAVRIRRG